MMTTIEAYYLAVCVAALSVFAIALAYNAWSWKSWKSSQSAEVLATKPQTREVPQTKLAA
jgi:hypothetical protein